MDTQKPLLSGLAATIVGTLGTLAAAASPVVPAPWGALVGIVGFLAAALAGLSVASPTITTGRPLLQGVALTVATGALALLVQFYPIVPAGWPQSVALGVAALLCWLTGQALPQLGSTPLPELKAEPPAPVSDLEEARRILGGGR